TLEKLKIASRSIVLNGVGRAASPGELASPWPPPAAAGPGRPPSRRRSLRPARVSRRRRGRAVPWLGRGPEQGSDNEPRGPGEWYSDRGASLARSRPPPPGGLQRGAPRLEGAPIRTGSRGNFGDVPPRGRRRRSRWPPLVSRG